MKTEGREDAVWGAEPPDEGWHQFRVSDRSEWKENEEKGSKTAVFWFESETQPDHSVCQPVCVEFRDDNGDAQKPRGSARQLADLAACTGLKAEFEKRYPNAQDWDDPEVAAKLVLKTVDKFFWGLVVHGQDKEGNKRARLKRITAKKPDDAKGGRRTTMNPVPEAETRDPNDGNQSDEDW